MADNSKREQILEDLKTALSGIESVATVERRHPSFDEAAKLPVTQLPFIGIVGGLPIPEDGQKYRKPVNPAQSIRSRMGIEIFFLAHEPDNPCNRISFFLDEIWRVIHIDTTRGGVAIHSQATCEPMPGIRHPYIAFFISISVVYQHDHNGI